MIANLKKKAQPYTLVFSEEPEEVKKLMDDTYNKLKDTIEMQGFRKGHVPRAVAEKQKWFNKFTLYRPVFDAMYLKAIKQLELDVVDAFDFEVKGPFEDSSVLTMQATVFLMPTVTSFDIDSVSVQKKSTTVTDEMVDDQIKIHLDKCATFTNVTEEEDYEIKDGDALIIDYEGKVNCKAFKGGTAKLFKYVVGQTKFIDGFGEQLLKFKAGETGVVKVTFPETYHAAELQGKDAEFTVTVRKVDSRSDVTVEQLAQRDEKTVEQFRNDIETKLVEDYKRINEEQFNSDVLAACVSAADIEPIPVKLVTWEIDNEWNQLMYRMGMTEEQYLKDRPDSKKSFYEQRRIRTEKKVQIKVFLDYVCRDQEIGASEQEVADFIKGQATMLQKSEEEKKEIMDNLKKEANYGAAEAAVKNDKATAYLVKYIKDKMSENE